MNSTNVIHIYNRRQGLIYASPEYLEKKKEAKKSGFLIKFMKTLSLALGVIGGVLILGTMASSAYSVLASSGEKANSEAISETAKNSQNTFIRNQKKDYEPPINTSLPLAPTVYIPSIGVSTKVLEAKLSDYEEALKQGVWRVPDFGTPSDRSKPIILAAHRYGYLKWSIPYRLKNSFYNLPKVKEGDIVKIVWGQREYTYEVYKSETGEEITDYSADLILYTCESLESPVRVFKYAKLLEI